MPIGVVPNPMWHSLKSIPLSSLSSGTSSQRKKQLQLQDVAAWRDTTLPYGMRFICVGDWLYGIGGAIMMTKGVTMIAKIFRPWS